MLEQATIRVHGADAADFLQGQLTNDIARLDDEAEIRAAWCNPKGRVLWFGTLTRHADGYDLSAMAEIADTVVARLSVYRFRAKVALDVVREGRTVDPAVLVASGCPWIGAAQFEAFTPHMLNLDLLDAISFDKGCYTGQEIVARTHYKGATKRRTLKFESDHPVSAGDTIESEGRAVGEVLNVADRELLAVVAIAHARQELHVGDATLAYRPLPYLSL